MCSDNNGSVVLYFLCRERKLTKDVSAVNHTKHVHRVTVQSHSDTRVSEGKESFVVSVRVVCQ